MRNRIIQAAVLLVALAVTAFSGRCLAQIAAQSSDSSAQTSQSSTQDNSQQTIDGCLVREEHAVYLMPASGDKTQVSAGDQDLNSHMGEEVRLKGNQGGSRATKVVRNRPRAAHRPLRRDRQPAMTTNLS